MMQMLGTVVTRLVQKVGLLISNVTTYLTQKLSRLRGVLTDLKTLYAVLLLQLNQFVLQLQKVKALVAQFISVALSIKAGLTNALRNLGGLGLQLLTTVRQTHQHVKALFSKSK
jgi:hypothetical protein